MKNPEDANEGMNRVMVDSKAEQEMSLGFHAWFGWANHTNVSQNDYYVFGGEFFWFIELRVFDNIALSLVFLTFQKGLHLDCLPLPNTHHIGTFADLVSSARFIVHLLLEIFTKKLLIILTLDSMWGTASIEGTEERIFQSDEEASLRSEELGHSCCNLCTKARVKGDKELIVGKLY